MNIVFNSWDYIDMISSYLFININNYNKTTFNEDMPPTECETAL